MPVDQKELRTAMSITGAGVSDVRDLFIAAAARDLVATAAAFAPDTDDFRDAIHADGPDGIHALIVVEEQVTEVFRHYPKAIHAMRDSIEWDEVVRREDALRAALAVVNESLGAAEKLWAARIEAKSAPGYR